MIQVLRCNDADDAVAFEDGHHLRNLSGHDAFQRYDQRVVRLSGLEGARHDALHISIAIGLQRLDDALS